MGLLHRDCAHWSRQQIVCGCCWHHLVGSTVELFQSFALHLQLHLGILFEDLRVALAKHLSHPLVGYSSGAQPCGIRGAEVVNPKIGNLCPSKSFSLTVLCVGGSIFLRPPACGVRQATLRLIPPFPGGTWLVRAPSRLGVLGRSSCPLAHR